MGNLNKNEQLEVVVVEFNVSMHCNACERTVARAISKFKGVETFTTDMNKHKVVVRGRIDPKKLLKKLKRKTGKRVEIVINNNNKQESSEVVTNEENRAPGAAVRDLPLFDCCKDSPLLMMFSDENPNACSIM
ncbi:hypothetical protein ACOSP7_007427 [Xanthoceras sorbifolium]|uniref:HMA domain-containing protein n=1 Tax=Xanthoceras sorbifolium TaxID=99658 RepID=A0ABQ8IB39_9ROSI|nr:hypothetical protein JRO89_XS03G0185400 [Xanthoceras sorbifolium]